MPRHHFAFPIEVRDAVRKHVRRAVEGVDPKSFSEEESYTAALAGRLVGTAYQGNSGSVCFKATVVASKGPNCAEHRSGADLIITAEVIDSSKSVRKAIMFQAKRGRISDLSMTERGRLDGQISKMKRLTKAPKILEYFDSENGRSTTVVSANRIAKKQSALRVELGDYFVRRVMTTMDGDTRDKFVDEMQESGLPTVHLEAILRPAP